MPYFTVKGEVEGKTKIASLQYGTGLAALVCQSKVRIYGNSASKFRFSIEERCLWFLDLPENLKSWAL